MLPRNNHTQYDDLGNTGVGPIPLNSNGGINYNNFKYVTVNGTLPQLTGVLPQSGRNVALLLMPAVGSFAASDRCFVLEQFHFGCTTTNVEPAANVPLQCRLSVTAYGADNGVVGSQEFTFTPNGLLRSTMDPANVSLPPAQLVLVEATILNLPPNLGSALTAVLFDDVTYTQYVDSLNCGF